MHTSEVKTSLLAGVVKQVASDILRKGGG